MAPNDWTISPNPFLHSGASVAGIYGNMCLALLPAALGGVFLGGWDALLTLCVSTASALGSEALTQVALRRPVTLGDRSAAFSGVLLGLLLPANAPLSLVIMANLAAMGLAKQCFGGLGACPLNPVLVGLALAGIPGVLTGHLTMDPGRAFPPLPCLKGLPWTLLGSAGPGDAAGISLGDLVLWGGSRGIGASFPLGVLAGGLYLILRGMIRWQTSLWFLLGVLGLASAFCLHDPGGAVDPLFQLLTGNVLLGAFFLATDYGSSPASGPGRVLFGLGCGALTVVFRAWDVYGDGVVPACLFMGLLVPLLDRIRRGEPEERIRPILPSAR